MSKPVWFPFFVRDWLSSGTVRSMSLAEVGCYIMLLAAAWDADEPGCLPADLRAVAKILGIDVRILRRFVVKYPGTFREVSGKLRNSKLCELAAKYKQISEKRAVAGRQAHQQMLGKSPDIPEADTDSDGRSLMQFSQDQQAVEKQERVSFSLLDETRKIAHTKSIAPKAMTPSERDQRLQLLHKQGEELQKKFATAKGKSNS
jgi:uncharacterized protein YdaU (DUF1376 family)